MTTHERRVAIMIATPLVSVATLMIGLRVGAGSAVRAAAVYAAPPGGPLGAGAVPIALQIVTYEEDSGIRATVGIDGLTVTARSGAEEARWSGSSNADGVAEAGLTFRAPRDTIDVEVRAPGEALPLASGVLAWGERAAAPADSVDGEASVERAAAPADSVEGEASVERAAVRPSARSGEIELDVLVEGGPLVVGEASSLFIRARAPGLDPAGISLDTAPEPGLRLADEGPRPVCDGWIELRVTADAHVVGLALEAREPGGRSGAWLGALPVAPGAFAVRGPRLVPAHTESSVLLLAPGPRRFAYAELLDERGRILGAALPLHLEGADPLPRARWTLPPLAPGLYGLVVSGDPRGAASGGATARPLLVGAGSGRDCRLGPWLATRALSPQPLRLALDGMEDRSAPNRARRRAGLLIGVGSLLAAAALEALLLTRTARESRARLRSIEAGGGALPGGRPDGQLLVGVLVTTLGFLLLAALVVAKS